MSRRRGKRLVMVDWVTAHAVIWTLNLLARLPKGLSYYLASRIGSVFWWVSKIRRRNSQANLVQAMGPDVDPLKIRSIAKESFRSLMKVALDFARLPQELRRESFLDNVDTTQLDQRLAEIGDSELVFVSGHLGGIEVGGTVLACKRKRVNVIARKTENRFLDQLIREGRQTRGLTIHPRRGGIKPLVRAVESGEDAALLIDQNQRKRGLFVPFFGRLAATDRSAAVLAMRRGKARPILIGFALRQGPAFRFKMEFAPVVYPTPAELENRDLAALTCRIVAEMEKIIIRYPEQYLWLHNRYKTRPPEEKEEQTGSSR